jgi:fructan beta-fructosidase
MDIKKTLFIGLTLLITLNLNAQNLMDSVYNEPYRPQIHFSPKEKWMNDPNGMVYYNGLYHLFFQFYPNGITWGPMHWGHATSNDLVHWQQQQIALFPDSLGYIFSGSAVVDKHNTTGLGKNGQVPLVAIFTHHDPIGEKAGTNTFQYQSLAYSLDEGKSWEKYSGNPVLKNPGIRDFRDPSVQWYAPQKKWVMTLATKDRVTFYSSPNLKEWRKESEFGSNIGAHLGVWECPNLFKLKLKEKTYWVLMVSVNPGGPNGGSATQYFIGDFNGTEFKTSVPNPVTKWADYGPDDYAGVTWSNTGNRKIFLGWMTNWTYAQQVPTEKWRSAMTVPRELKLMEVNNDVFLRSTPVKELKDLEASNRNLTGTIQSTNAITLDVSNKPLFKLNIDFDKIGEFTLVMENNNGNKLEIGYDSNTKAYYINRSKSGIVDFNSEFPKLISAPRLTSTVVTRLELILDASSVEVFADNGLTVLISTYFTKNPFNKLTIKKNKNTAVKTAKITGLKSIW